MNLQTSEDAELLRAYAEARSEAAFTELVRRHLDWVHASALRQTEDRALAEDVAQSVFILLARKAATLNRRVKLSGWLFATTRFVAARARRAELRRSRRESAFSTMNSTPGGPEPLEVSWTQLEPHLDHAVASLPEPDRTAVLTRYFERRSLRDVGDRLGITEEAARKRVQRAVEKLRSLVARRGASLSGAALATLLAERAVSAAPPNLAAEVVHATSSLTISSAMPELAKDTLAAWRWGRMKAALGFAIPTVALVVVLSIPHFDLRRDQATSSPGDNAAGNVSVPNASGTNFALASPSATFPRGPVLAVAAFDSVTGRALTNASVYRRVVAQDEWREETGWTTDARGICLLPLPPTGLQRLDVGVIQQGFAARFATWFPANDDPVPGNYTFRLAPAEALGGTVLDSNNQPLPRAEIIFNFHNTGDASARETPRERLGCLDFVAIATTDQAGHWSGAISAPGADNFNFIVRHPDYPRQSFSLSDREELQRNNAIFRLQAGRTIRGLVLDAEAKPVTGARLWAGRGEEPDARATSTSQGEFVLTPVPTSCAITVMADGFELQQAEVETISAANQLTFRLKPALPFRVRVVDETGAPVPHAEIALEEWPGGRRSSVEFREATDAEGRLVWLSPPPGELEWCALKRGYRYSRDIQLSADGTEHVIRMQRALVVTGTVTDAATGAPVLEFRAIPGYNPERPNWHRSDRRLGTSGAYSLPFSENGAPIVQIEADGYESAEAQPELLNPIEGEANFKLRRLDPANDIRGVVQFPDRTPAAGVEVALCTADAGVTVVGTSFEKRVNSPSGWAPLENYRTVTDEAGQFRFRSFRNAHTVVAVSAAGFGKTRCQTDSTPLVVPLQPWGQLTGVVQIRGQAVANRKVIWLPPGTLTDWQTVNFNAGAISALTDIYGRFVLSGVPPGDAQVAVQSEHSESLTHHTFVLVRPGESVEAKIGGSGGSVRGRLRAAGWTETDWQHRLLGCELSTVWPGIPSQPRNLSSEALQKWRLDFWDSPEALTIRKAKQSYAVSVSPDGSFAVTDVAPGRYDIRARIIVTNGPAGGAEQDSRRVTSYLHGHLTVPPSSDGSSNNDASFDAGEILVR